MMRETSRKWLSVLERIIAAGVLAFVFYRWIEYPLIDTPLLFVLFAHIVVTLIPFILTLLFFFLVSRRTEAFQLNIALVIDLYTIIVCIFLAGQLAGMLAGSKEILWHMHCENVPKEYFPYYRQRIASELYIVLVLLGALCLSALRRFRADERAK